jgi:prepilin-type N-terminal cleavage/methylation domain-containing protein
MQKKRGFTLIELLIVVAIIAILAAIAVPNFLEAQVRAKVSRVRADLRSIATALESYFIDNNAYPIYTTDTTMSVNASLNLGTNMAGTNYPTFRIIVAANDFFQTVTTPVAFITSYFSDPFSLTRGVTFAYYTDTAGWIIWSMGPDSDENNGTGQPASDLAPHAAYETVYTSAYAQPSISLVAGGSPGAPDGDANGTEGNSYTYDPTNGTTSEGDVYRVRQ